MLSSIVWNEDTIAILGVFAVPIVAILGGIWLKIATITSENELKRSMIERGMSADEIERVLAARSNSPRK